MVPESDIKSIQQWWPSGVVLTVLSRNADGFSFRRSDKIADLAVPPHWWLALIGSSDAGIAELTRFAVWAKEQSGQACPEPRWLTGPDAAVAALAALHAGALVLLCRQAELAVTSLRSLAELRRVREDQQQRLTALEDFISTSNLQPHENAFVEAQDAERPPLELGRRGGVRRVTQVLPVSSLGVTAIALHLGQPSFTRVADLTVTLETLEDGEECATWTVPPDDQGAGWIILGLEYGISGLRRTLRLVLEVPEFQGTCIVSLGGPQALPMFRIADSSGQPLADVCLALQIWTGLPGVSPPLNAVHRFPDTSSRVASFQDVAGESPSPASDPKGDISGENGTTAEFVNVRLDERYEDSVYRHLDLSVEYLTTAEHEWPHVKFKISEMYGVYSLEFRRGAGWPEMFNQFPQGQVDEFSEVWRLRDLSTAPTAIADLPSHADRSLLQTLLLLLPNLVELAGGQGDLSHEAGLKWRMDVEKAIGSQPNG